MEKQTSLITETKPRRKIDWLVAGGILFIAFLFFLPAIVGAVSPKDNPLELAESAYKSAHDLHEQTSTQEKLAAKNECKSLAVLAALKLASIQQGGMTGDKNDLSNKSKADCTF